MSTLPSPGHRAPARRPAAIRCGAAARWWTAVLGAAALAVPAMGCGGGASTPRGTTSPRSPAVSSAAATGPARSGPATTIAAYPVRVGTYRLVDRGDHPVGATTQDHKFPQSFSFAATARDGYYLPGHQKHQIVYLIAGRLAPGVPPATAITDYLGSFSGQEQHLTTEPAGPLGGAVRCWTGGGITFCMWADNGTYGVFDYEPPLGLDTALIRHLAGVVPRFRRAMERAQE